MAPRNFKVVVGCARDGAGLCEMLLEGPDVKSSRMMAFCPSQALDWLTILESRGIEVFRVDAEGRPVPPPPRPTKFPEQECQILYADTRVDPDFLFGRVFDAMECDTLLLLEKGGFSVPRCRRAAVTTLVIYFKDVLNTTLQSVASIYLHKYRRIQQLFGMGRGTTQRLLIDLTEDTATFLPEGISFEEILTSHRLGADRQTALPVKMRLERKVIPGV